MAVPMECFRCDIPLDPGPGNHKVRIKPTSPFLRSLLQEVGGGFEAGNYLCKKCHNYCTKQTIRPALGRIRSEPGGTIDILRAVRTHGYCVVCGQNPHGKTKVPPEAVAKCFLKKRVVVALSSSVCRTHLNGLYFSDSAFASLITRCHKIKLTDATFDLYMNQADSIHDKCRNSEYWYEPSSSKRTPQKCKLRFGLNDEQFDTFFDKTSQYITGKTGLAKRRNLAIFLTKMRTNASLRSIGIDFGLHHTHISKIIGAVGTRLAETYAPQYLGFQHITHADFKELHSTTFADELLQLGPDDVAVFVDATYLYCEKSSNFDLQKKTFNPHKLTNLVKPTTFCAADGYFLAMSAIFGSDGSNNDATILSALMKDPAGLSFFANGKKVVLVLDRGYRDVIQECHDLGYQTRMPSYLSKSAKQHTTTEANESRLVTKNRWIVESAHGRIKNVFRFFSGKMSNKFIPKFNNFLQVVCAISNDFFDPIATNKPEDEILAAEMIHNVHNTNEIQNLVIQEKLLHKRLHGAPIHTMGLPDFPVLSRADIEHITYGTYQLRLAPSYLQKNALPGGGYRINGFVQFPNLLRFEIKSRFKSSLVHKMWIQYQPNLNGYESVKGYYCTCKMGARTVGTCSHVASVLWYMGEARHSENVRKPAAYLGECLLDAKEILMAMEQDNDSNSDTDDTSGDDSEEEDCNEDRSEDSDEDTGQDVNEESEDEFSDDE